jgi:hypothetical protein
VHTPDASQDESNHRIRRVDVSTGATTTLAGSGTSGYSDGVGTSAQFYQPFGVAIDPAGAFALVAVRARAFAAPASRPRPRRPRRTHLPGLHCPLSVRCAARRHAACRAACPSLSVPMPMHRRIHLTTASAVSTSPPDMEGSSKCLHVRLPLKRTEEWRLSARDPRATLHIHAPYSHVEPRDGNAPLPFYQQVIGSTYGWSCPVKSSVGVGLLQIAETEIH